MIFCSDEGDAASFAAAIFLGDAVDGETLYFVEDVEAAAEVDLPAVVQPDEAVVGGVKVVGEVDATRGEVIGDGIEDVNDIRPVLIIVGRGKVYLKSFRICDALFNGLDEFDEVVYLVRLPDKRVGKFHLVSSSEIWAKQFSIGNTTLVHADFFDGAGKLFRSGRFDGRSSSGREILPFTLNDRRSCLT